MDPQEAARELEQLEQLDDRARRYDLEHSLCIQEELTFEGYGGAEGELDVMRESCPGVVRLSREEVARLSDYLKRWLAATEELEIDLE